MSSRLTLVVFVVGLLLLSCTGRRPDAFILDSGTPDPLSDAAAPREDARPDLAEDQNVPLTSWAVSAGGTDHDYGKGIAVDSLGNSYITGAFQGHATFGSKSVTSNGGDVDVYVAKVDSVGKAVWAVSAGGTAGDAGYAIAVDGSGNSYVTGQFTNTAPFGSTTLTSKGNSNHSGIFVAKLGPSGTFTWAASSGGTSTDNGTSIAVDGSGNSYVTGHFNGNATFGSTTLTSKGRDLFIAKVNASGKFAWAVSAGGTGEDRGRSIAVDSSGNSHVTGEFEGTATFGSATLTSKGSREVFVAKLDSGGTFVWAVSAGGTSEDYGRAIAVDGAGNSYVAGGFANTTVFGSTTLSSTSKDAYVAKVDSGGSHVLAVTAGGHANDASNSIAVDGSGNCYVTGEFKGTAKFGSTSLASKGNSEIFVAKFHKSELL